MKNNGKKKLVSIVVPVYNEEECLTILYTRIAAVMDTLTAYETELVFFDDGSTDSSRELIEHFCEIDSRCKAVFFARNYGYNIAIFYAVQQAKGDCAVLIHADLQNPPELIPKFVAQWEQGHDAVFGVKNKSRENPVMYFLRTVMYLVFNLVFGMHLIPHATDFELVDASLIRGLRQNTAAEPILRIILKDKACNPSRLFYTQDKRAAGKSKFDFVKYYELAISWISASPPVLPRRFLCLGIVLFVAGLFEMIIGFLLHSKGLAYLQVSTNLIIRAIFLSFSIFICFSALLGEFIIKNRPGKEAHVILEENRIRY